MIAGVLAVGATDWRRLDPAVALVVALNSVVTGTALLRRAGAGLIDHALPPAEQTLQRTVVRAAADAPARGLCDARPRRRDRDA